MVFHDKEGSGIFWEVVVGNGKLHFAASTQGDLDRLKYCLSSNFPSLAWHPIPSLGPYDLICHFWQSGELTLKQVRQALLEVTSEGMTQLLAIPQTDIQFERVLGLDPILLDVPIQTAIASRRTQIQRWRQLRPTIPSPFQRIVSGDRGQLFEHLSELLRHLPPRDRFDALLDESPCLYRMAECFSVDVLRLAELIGPLVESGAIRLGNLQAASDRPRLTIACIDDSKAVQRKVRLTLESAGYDVLELLEPARALTALVRRKPSAILLDITMPEISGYELCRLLRQSAALKDVPILMLTGRDGAIDRLRARMAGSTDYITKPFNSQDLLSRIERLISSKVPQV
ncbi:response regulator [Synechococcus sp. PCC 7336]|uniref:response regulator n=1 Tax=Synechococcus sp. PCC 7336 TaxID=195250 RepID=UPI0003715BB6|nr:response regulator [Synechococcus sp. PCC 7336]